LILCPMYSCVLTAFTIKRISINVSYLYIQCSNSSGGGDGSSSM